MPMKILTVFGTRPEAVKLAPVILEFKKNKKHIKSFVCLTGQHKEMVRQVLSTFEITPDYDLNIMKKGQTIEEIIVAAIIKIQPILDKIKPHIILVQGDTTTAFIISLAGFLKKIKIAHVEAGLRTYDKYRPFPEEINRALISRIADFHFVPTEQNKKNLIKENIRKSSIFVTGNTVVDALLFTSNKIDKNAGKKFFNELPEISNDKKIILVTAHRRESFGSDMDNICAALKKIVVLRPDAEIVYPVHMNPNVRISVNKILKCVERIHLIEPLGYEAFVALIKRAYLILTDSGGIQEEAPSFNKPVLIMRDVTERSEGIKAGCARLVGVKTDDIVSNTLQLLDDKTVYIKMSRAKNPYGDGMSAKKITNILLESKSKKGIDGI
ncbi:UDP-N-acetylglucosamine 2-epimerase [Candidatus Omnitrophus magneticus]|uniref:UDP-N-acetylglucosamine 2-epimerase (non-hydrolyzing) n=1 Tax=Candidatus Omnitrophus magneticus TaxID=1609969 RepID=A0A0F0CNP9_9BACT|nr:UDP-N-acetylglucosamine 2-epimerase [Candidatus Omnitrophus magneticus]